MTIRELKIKIEETKALIRAHSTAALKEAFRSIFDAYPQLAAVRWNQYTPYFNDGDVCTFGIHDFYVRLNDTSDEDGEMEDGFLGSWETRDDANVYNIFTALRELEDDEIFQFAFGDHVQVTATRDSIDVEEYEHD